jgi:hypothetical protein
MGSPSALHLQVQELLHIPAVVKMQGQTLDFGFPLFVVVLEQGVVHLQTAVRGVLFLVAVLMSVERLFVHAS